MAFPTESYRKICPSTTSASSTSNISPTTIYAEILKARPDVRLDRLENESPADDVSAPILSAAHAYQIGAARDELAPHFHATCDLLKRDAEPADRSPATAPASIPSTSTPARRPACVVVNQSGGNANSVAEHALGMMITLSKRIIEADRALRRERQCQPQCADGQRGQGQDHRHRRHRQCRPPHRRTLQGPAAHEGACLRSLSVRGRNRRARRREGRARRSAARVPISSRSPAR